MLATRPSVRAPAVSGGGGGRAGGARQPARALGEFFRGGVKRSGGSAEKAEVLRLAEAQRRGVGHSAEDRAAMEAAIDALVVASGGGGGVATSSERLTADWRLVWSSEQETLFLLEKFGGPDADAPTQAYQAIDVDAATLSNSVCFSNGNVFVVESDIEVEGDTKVNFQFTSARLELVQPFKFTLNLPPFGQGWFDNIYVDDTMRVARDSRGDTLVVVRD